MENKQVYIMEVGETPENTAPGINAILERCYYGGRKLMKWLAHDRIFVTRMIIT